MKMQHYWIKVCGLSREEDIDVCIDNNVDALGFLLEMKTYKRADMLPLHRLKELIAYANGKIETCLLIHLKELSQIIETIKALNPSMIQIQKQSYLSIEDLEKIKTTFPKLKIIKTFYLTDTNKQEIENDIQEFINSKTIDFVLIDSAKGGSGLTHNWGISATIIHKFSPFPCIIAGGLAPHNVQEAIIKTEPFGVDVMSGVSICSGGVKDSEKIKLFCNEVKNVF